MQLQNLQIMRLACTLSRYKYVLYARSFLKLACLGGRGGSIFCFTEACPIHSHIYSRSHPWLGKGWRFCLPCIDEETKNQRKDLTRGSQQKVESDFLAIFFPLLPVQAQLQDRMSALNSRIWMLTSQFNTVENVIFLMTSLWVNQIKVTKNVNSAARPRFESWLCYSLPAWLQAISK